MPPTITDNPALNRYELAVDGGVAFVSYRRSGNTIELLHAEVPPQLEGRGLGSRLARETLELIRAEGLRVVPRCGFIAAFMRRNREFSDLLA